MKDNFKKILPPPTNSFIREINFLKEDIEKLNKRVSDSEKKINKKIREQEERSLRMTPQPFLSYFVLNIVDHCNLNCRGCDHFACIAKEHFVSLEDIKKDLEQLSRILITPPGRIGIMGGEPLLHAEIKEIMQLTRKAFPHSLVQLVTNGLLLLKQTDEFWTCCHDNEIQIVNTKYPINQNYDKMIETSKEKEVSFKFFGNTNEVLKTLFKIPLDLDGQQNVMKSFRSCHRANNCAFLMEGKFYPCTAIANVIHFNAEYNKNLLISPSDYLLLDQVKTEEELLQFIASPVPFCRYCNTQKRQNGIPWERTKRQINEWTL